MIELVISAFVILGGLLTLLGAIGIIRLPDVYGRLHAATKSATLGVISIMVAVFLYFVSTEGVFSGKVLLTILFVFMTAPVAAFMISRSAYTVGVKMFNKGHQDDLAKYENREKEISKN
ncbi:multicomponent Na+:H+ antiporter subunit G [Texcoconibacillus texcoconensis]|uniref:Multicomponent Na+:H+ antiporter subunit G n=1 Tax=Texcoconibacillus texcoconensis TaxID=1095777 RepID=A0A840QRN2_9BACI|nr:monovalent cation/H(+) antiporter subunit G [Texcoconibacillus texcoconensis]MBB5173983.1 multicomponent Na+:H+ antiporter subunit G [Texcoconibacillus texcoconensis]